MINRRTLLLGAGATAGSLALWRPVGAITRTEASAVRTFTGVGPITFLSAYVGEYLDADRAEAAWLRFVEAAPEDYDHRYDPSVFSDELSLPTELRDMAGRLILTTTVVGAAAVRSDRMTGVFRRGSLVWVLKTSGAGPWEMDEVIVDLMSALKARSISSSTLGVDDNGLQTGGLWDLLPGIRDVPDGYALHDERSPATATPKPV